MEIRKNKKKNKRSNKMKKLLLWLSIQILVVSNACLAHNNKIIHPFVLTGKAWILLKNKTMVGGKTAYRELDDSFYTENIPSGYSLGNDNYDISKIVKQGTLGTIEEDGTLGIRSLNHFYNPYNPPNYEPLWGFAPGIKNAVEWGRPIWEEAIEKYGEGKKGEGFLALGRVIHLLEDMSSPPHVHSDAHIDILGSNSNNFEKWCYTSVNDNQLEFLRQLEGRNIKGGFTSWDRFLIDLAEYTYDAVKIEGHLIRDPEHPGEGDLVEMFPEIAYLKYIPLKEEDPSVGYWWIYGVGYCYSGPKIKTIWETIFGKNDDWWRCGPADGGEYYYIENPRYAIAYDYRLIPHIGPWANQPKDLCKIWVEDYALFPLTIEHTSGLMKYFYDIINEPPYVKEVSIKQEGTEIYGAYWKDQFDSSGKLIGRTLRPLSGEEINPKIAKAGKIVITVTFSEPVYELSASDIRVGGRNLDTYPILIDGNVTWQGTFTIPSDGSMDGQQQISILAGDKNEHLTTRNYAGDKLDSNPSTIAKAKSTGNYDWTGYEPGRDSNHRFHIITRPIIIQHSTLPSVPANLDLNVPAFVLQTQEGSISSVSLYYRKVGNGFWYTKLEMTPEEENKFSAVIPAGNISAERGLEYYIFVQDSDGNTCSWPEGIADPFFYSGPGQKVTVHTVSNGGIIVQGDEDKSNDSVDISFYLVQDTDVNIELHRATDNWEYLKGSDSPDNAYDTIDWYWVTGGGGPGQKYTVTWGDGCESIGNYFYILRDANSGERIAQGRLVVVLPLLGVVAYSTQSGDYDNVTVEASGYSEGLFSASAFQDNSFYKAYNQRGLGPEYTISIPRQGKDHQYRAGVYASSWGEQVLIGMSDVKSINEKGAPFISHRGVESPQTHNYPIDVSAGVTDGDGVREVLMFYKGVKDSEVKDDNWTQATMSKSQTDDNIYRGQIESQPYAGTVYYYLQATDNEGNVSTDPWYNPKGKPYSFEIIFDNVPPVVTRTNPENGATGVNLDLDVTVTFSEKVRSGNGETIRVKDANGKEKEVAWFDYGPTQLTFKLKGLKALTTYFCEITSGVVDRSGNSLVPYRWSFVTKEVLPPAITEVSPISPENFLATTGKMVFSCKFSRPVSEVKIIFKNTSTDEEFTVTESNPILTSRDDRYSYIYAWNGKDDTGKYLPDGQYKFRIEATDDKYGVLGSSEFQPFNWLVRANGTITYPKVYKYWGGGTERSITLNFPQTIHVHYNYLADPFGPMMKLHIGDETRTIGDWWDRAFGKPWGLSTYVPANTNVSISGGMRYKTLSGRIFGHEDPGSYVYDKASIEYEMRYLNPYPCKWIPHPDYIIGIWGVDLREYLDMENPKHNEVYETLDYHAGSTMVARNTNITEDFSITLVPDERDQMTPHDKEFDWGGDSAGKPVLFGVHIVHSGSLTKVWYYWNLWFEEQNYGYGEDKEIDYDDNPEVETWVDGVASFEDKIIGVLRARNISPPISPFIFDRTPPEIDVYVSSSTFSPRLKQEVDIAFTVTDNLLFPLKDVSLKIYDSNNNLVKNLYEKSSDSPGTRKFAWDGKGSDAYNGGEIVSDGAYTYAVQAKDEAGNPNSFSDTLIVDTTPPEICDGSLLVIPANHPRPDTFTTKDDVIQMTFNLSDNLSSSVNMVMVVESTSFGVLMTRQKPYGVTATLQRISEQWDGKDDQGNYLPDGTYKITLIATDLAGNRSEPLVLSSFSIDRTPSVPTTLYVDNLRFTPDDGPRNQGDGYQDTVTLHYILSEEALVSVRVDDVLGRTILSISESSNFGTEGAHLWDGKVDGNFVSDGSYIFRIKTTDDVGNIAYGNISVIKNQIPAQIVFPSKDIVPVKVSGLVTIKGIALDPGINNPANFKWYKVWYRGGKDIDFSLSENEPLRPDLGIWHPVPVPAYNQNGLDPNYPNSNVSWRAVAYTTLATWDTTNLTSGSHYTILLVTEDTEDEEGNSSYDFVTVEVDQAIDNTRPQASITHPSDLSEFRIVSDTSTLSIVYDLAQNSGKQADVSLVIFKMSDNGANYGPIVYHRDYLSRSEGQTIRWDGKDNLRRYVENGRYRIRLTALDRDGLGGSVAEVDITVKVIVTEPLKIVKFAASDSVIDVGDIVDITCKLSKEASVTLAIYDALENLVETLVDSVVTPGEAEQRVTWTSQMEGLYTCRIIAIATDADKTRDEASLSIAVTGADAGTGIAEITSPQEGAIVKGEANYNWQASAQGEHYPPQVFSATVAARGKEWLGPYDWIQSTNSDFKSGTKSNLVVINNEVKLTYVSESKFLEQQEWDYRFSSRWYLYDYQTFIPRINVRLKKIKLFFANLFDEPQATTVTVQVRKVISSSGNILELGGVLGEKSLYISLPAYPEGAGRHPFTFNFSLPIDLYRNQAYCFRLSYAENDQILFIGMSDKDPYPDGRYYCYNHHINKWYDNDRYRWLDFTFELIGDYYEPYGYIISSEFDTGTDTTIWEKFNIRQDLPSGTKITYETFSYDASGTPWDASRAVPALPGEMIKSPSKRYIRWKANFSTSEPSHSPVLKEAKVSFIKEKDWEFTKTFEDSQYYCWYEHPLYVPKAGDLSVFFPELEGKNITSGPFYSIVSETNPQVAKTITNENGYYQLMAMTEVVDRDWDTADDRGLSGGRIVSIDNEFNNSLNPEDFIIESSPITISTGYPNVNMWVADEVKNKYTFWRNAEGSLIDNPYVSVNTNSWDIRVSYPDRTENRDLIINRQADKPSNTNTTALDDDFTVRLSSSVAPKVFVELKGNTSTLAQGFKGYLLFYKKPEETVWKSIPSASKSPVINSGTLGWWDVTGLNGEYIVKMIVLDDSGSNELTKNMIIGTKVPSAEATASPPNYVTSPYNKAFLSFPPDALEKDTIVTITPVRLEDTGVSIDPHMPEPIGAFYKLQPKEISFSKDSAGNVLYPASFSVRFTYEELQGVDPGHLTIYHVKDDGSLESLDVKVVYDENGNGLFDPGEIATVTSPITSFSYYLVIPMILSPTLEQIPSPTNQKSVTLTGQAQNASSVEVFINGASLGNVDVNEDGKFSMPLSLVTGSNRITCIGTGWFNDIKRTSNPSAPIEVVLDMGPPEITDVYDSPDPFTPNGDGIRDNAKIFYTLSEESLVELKIYKEESLVRTLVDSSKIESGPHSEVWDGKDDEGSMVEGGIYTYKIDATDLAGNTASQQEGQLEVSYQTMAPPAPTLLAPPDEEYIDSTTPTFQISPDETVERQLRYSIEISTDDFKTIVKRYDQTVSTEGWTLEGEIIQYTISQENALRDAIYKWRAFSYDDFQWSDSSAVWTFKLDMEPPAKPKLLSPEEGASVNSPKPTFDWEDVVDAVSGLDCYEIQIDNNSDFGSPEYIVIVTASQFIPQSDLAQGEYYWRVRARDKRDHNSDWTDPWRFTRTNSPPDGPTLMSPENGKFIMTKLPTFQIFSTDPDNDPLKCKIEISTDNFSTIGRYYDQNISTTGWKVVEVPSSPQGLIVQYTIQPGDELAEGIYYWRACVYDGTLWSDNSAIWNFTLDMSSATISVASPVKGEVYNARQRMIEIEFTVADLDPNPTINAYLQNGDNIRIVVSSGETIEPLDIEDGLWNLIVESTDWAGNVSSMVAGPFEVTHDIRPPRTSIVVGEPNYGQDPVYITSDTQFTLTSVDDYFTIGDGKGLGLSLTEYSIDGNDWTTYTGTFTVTLGEAPHTIYYRSIDKGGLREETKSQDIVIDNKVPQIILIAEGNLSTNGIDNFASLSCQYRLAVIGDSSWVDHTEFKVDGTEWKTYTASFGFDAAGEHIIKYRIVSKTGNPEKENVFEVIVDNTLPVTTLNSSPPLYNGLYASTSTIYSISGIDTLVDGKASGMAEIKYRIDEEEFKTYFQNFVLTGGQHTIHYYGRDNVNNVEKPNPFNVVVDTVPPQTTLTPSESLYEDGENIFASISCMYSLKSFQNLSGVNRIEFSIDNGDWQIYKSSISFLTEGIHAIKYKAVSNTGVWEEEKRFSFIIDVKGPKIASVYPENGAYVRAPDLTAIRICFAEPVKIGDDKWENGVSISETKSGALVRGNIRYDDIEYAVTFSTRFEDHTPYNIKLTSEIRDKVGNPLKEFASSFTTLMLKEKGGKVEEGEVWLDIPPNALPQDAVIIINKEQDEIVNKIPRPLQSFEKDTLYHIVAYNQDHQEIQQKLKKPMEMKISYGKLINSQVKDSSEGGGKGVADFSLRLDGVDPKTLKLYWYNPEKERWEIVENSKNDSSVKEVIAQVERFGRYCLMGFVPFGDSLEGLSNYPNPFPAFGKDYTTIQYYLKDDADVAIAIYDLMGNLVKVFEKKKGEEGGRGGDLNRVEWDGRNGRGDKVANGGYICRVQIDDGKRVKSKIRKILVIK